MGNIMVSGHAGYISQPAIDATSNHIGVAQKRRRITSAPDEICVSPSEEKLAERRNLQKDKTDPVFLYKVVILDPSKSNFIERICKAGQQFVTHLNASDVSLSNAGAELIAQIKTLISLKANRCLIGDTGAIALAKCFTLTTLHLADNPISEFGCKAILRHKKLMHLDLSGINMLDLNSALETLANNKTLAHLGLRGCKNTALPADLLSKWSMRLAMAVAAMPQLVEVDLSHNPIGDEAATVLAKSKIAQLWLKDTRISANGAEAFSKGSATLLDLSDNDLGMDGIAKLAQHDSVETLYLNHVNCPVWPKTTFNSSLKTLSVALNRLNPASTKQFQSYRSLERLDLTFTDLRDRSVPALTEIVTLKELRLGANERIGNKAAIFLSMKKIPLRKVDFSETNIARNGIGALTGIKDLHIECNPYATDPLLSPQWDWPRSPFREETRNT